MEAAALALTRAEYCPQGQHYVVSEYLLPRLAANHITPREIRQTGNEEWEKGQGDRQRGKRTRFIYAEEVLYMTYIAEFQHYQAISPDTAREEWERLKQNDILAILSNLSEEGCNKLEFVHFYLKIRKKSKLIERYSVSDHDDDIPLYKVYKTADDFKHKLKGELYLLVEAKQPVANILAIKQKLYQDKTIKIQILSSLDGITVSSKPTLTITDNKVSDSAQKV